MRPKPSDMPVRPALATSAIPDLLLVNPTAGAGLAGSVIPALRRFAGSRGWPVDIRRTGSAREFAALAAQGAAAGHPRLFAVGGDGTFQLLLNTTQGSPQTVLGIIPAGGGNDLAAALGLPPDPLKAAALLIEGETFELDAIRVRTAEGRERLYTGGGGVGLDAEASLFASGSYRNLRGRLRYLLSAIRALGRYHAVRVSVSVDGNPEPIRVGKALLASALNTPTFGAGLALAPAARLNDGKLDLVLLERLSRREILSILPALALRGELRTQKVRRLQASCIRIETEPQRSFHCDGEIIGTTPVEIQIVPRACRVVRPARVSSSYDPA